MIIFIVQRAVRFTVMLQQNRVLYGQKFGNSKIIQEIMLELSVQIQVRQSGKVTISTSSLYSNYQ